jgi:uncharacterized protein YbjT (DUF2867 family)
MAYANRTILVTGATGKQGGALIDNLAGQGFTLRAMTSAAISTTRTR